MACTVRERLLSRDAHPPSGLTTSPGHASPHRNAQLRTAHLPSDPPGTRASSRCWYCIQGKFSPHRVASSDDRLCRALTSITLYSPSRGSHLNSVHEKPENLAARRRRRPCSATSGIHSLTTTDGDPV